MTQSTLDRIWNQLVDRYGQDDEGGCGCGSAEESLSETGDEFTDNND
jgi:hypothetical protein